MIQRVATQKIDDAADARERCYRGAVHSVSQLNNDITEMSKRGQTGWFQLVAKSVGGKLSGKSRKSTSRKVLEHSCGEPGAVFTAFVERLKEMTDPQCHDELTIDIAVDEGIVSASITEGETLLWGRDA